MSRSARFALLLAPRFVRESRSDREHTPDVAGAVTITAGLALLVYAVSKRRTTAGHRAGRSSRLVVAAVLSIAFLVVESRAKDPLMPFRIFRVHTVAGANVAGLAARRSRVRELLPAHAVRAERARLVGAEDRAHLHRDGRLGRPLGRACAGARDEDRREEGDGTRLRRDDCRTALVHADPRARVVLVRPAARLPAHRLRAAVLVHPGLDRGARRRRAARGRPCVGSDQHRAAGRRRDRRRRHLIGAAHATPTRCSSRASVPGGVHERHPMGVLGHRRDRDRGPRRDARPDPGQGDRDG